MNPWKRLFFYLFLNAVVSAVTTLTVISIWDRTHKPTIQPVVQPVAQLAATKTREAELLKPSVVPPMAATSPTEKQDATAVSSTPEKVSAPAGGSMQIENVFGVGDLNTEVILLKHTGNGELWLTGWKLEDENNHRYIFPQLMLNKDGAIKLYTKPGTNTVIELHWGIKEPVWKSGELVTLLDQNGTAQATYRIP
jgi:hypothetical protein